MFFFFSPSTVCSNFDSQGHLNKSSKPFEKQPYVLLSSRMFSANFRWMVGKRVLSWPSMGQALWRDQCWDNS